MGKLTSNFTTLLILIGGVFFGIILLEGGLRALGFEPYTRSLEGYRTATLPDFPKAGFWQGLNAVEEADWLVLGGRMAAAENISPKDWFGHVYGETSGLKFYNASFPGGSRYLVAAAKAVQEVTGTQTKKAIMVVDMSLMPETLLNQEEDLMPPRGEDSPSFWRRFALLRVLGVRPAPKEAPYTEEEATKIAEKIKAGLAAYDKTDESAIVLLVPARGYWLEGKLGAMHRSNQEQLGLALRRMGRIYVVDIAYMMRDSTASPLTLYTQDGNLNADGHKALAEGLRRQMAVFSNWRTPEELSPEERQKLDEDLQKHFAKEAERKVKLPF